MYTDLTGLTRAILMRNEIHVELTSVTHKIVNVIPNFILSLVVLRTEI